VFALTALRIGVLALRTVSPEANWRRQLLLLRRPFASPSACASLSSGTWFNAVFGTVALTNTLMEALPG